MMSNIGNKPDNPGYNGAEFGCGSGIGKRSQPSMRHPW